MPSGLAAAAAFGITDVEVRTGEESFTRGVTGNPRQLIFEERRIDR